MEGLLWPVAQKLHGRQKTANFVGFAVPTLPYLVFSANQEMEKEWKSTFQTP
ncbi:MAG: hypothetical protein NC324_02005 [Bacteroides sp.]|nr:hypothetical protein [Bacteroides sp.]